MKHIKPNLLWSLLAPQLFFWSFVFQWITRSLPGAQLVTQLIIGLILMGLLLRLITEGKKLYLPKFALPAGLLVLLQALTIPTAPLPNNSLDIWLLSVLLFIILIVFVNTLREQARFQVWENSLLFISVFVALLNLALVILRLLQWGQLTATYGLSIPFRYRLPGLFLNHPNVEAAFTNLFLPILLGRIFLARQKAKKLGLTLLVIILALNLYFSSSRGAWVAAIVSITCLGILCGFAYFSERGANFRAFLARSRQKLIIYGLPVLFGILTISGFLLLNLFQSTGRPSLWPSRVRPWSIGWSLFSSAPIFGHGFGSTLVLIATDPSIPTEPYLVHTHNIVLQIGAELGVIGLVISGWLLYEINKRFFRSFAVADYDSRIRIASAGAGLIGLLVHHLVDYFFLAPIFSVAAVFLLTAGETYSKADGREWALATTARKAFAGMGILLILASFAPILRFEYTEAVNTFKTQPTAESASRICQIAHEHPSRPFFEFTCGLAAATSEFRNPHEGLREEAISAYREGLVGDPYWPIHWANLAALESDAGLTSQALEHIQIALESAPTFAIFNFNYARMLEQSGQKEISAEYYKRAVAAEPCLINSGFLNKERVDLSDFSGSDLFTTGSELNDRAQLAWYHYCSGQNETAREEFIDLIGVNPVHASARSGLALISLQADDYREAKKQSAIALYANPNLMISQYTAGKVAFAMQDHTSGGKHFDNALNILRDLNYSQSYYNVVYRGPYLVRDLVPQVESLLLSDPIALDLLDFARSSGYADSEDNSTVVEQLNFWAQNAQK